MFRHISKHGAIEKRDHPSWTIVHESGNMGISVDRRVAALDVFYGICRRTTALR